MIQRIAEAETRHAFPSARTFPSRVGYLRTLCHAQRVLHVGCVDAGYYERHSLEGRFIHDDLMEVAANTIGVDIDADGLDRMRADGYSNLVVADIAKEIDRAKLVPIATAQGGLDWIVCGEVIEHVFDQLSLVRGLLVLSQATGASIVLTTPNPFYWGRFAAAARRRETVHPDHTAYISAGVLESLVRRAGQVEYLTIDFYTNPSPSLFTRIAKNAIAGAFPCVADGIIARWKASTQR